MKCTIPTARTVDIAYIRVTVPVRYGDEDIPRDFPGRTGKTWTATINADTGAIYGWPKGRTGDLHMKVCDEGTYEALDAEGCVVLARSDEYVPDFFPGRHFGDYLMFTIDADGVIYGWCCDASDLEEWTVVGEEG